MGFLLSALGWIGGNKRLLAYAGGALALFMLGWHLNGSRWNHKYQNRETEWANAQQKVANAQAEWLKQKQAETTSAEAQAAAAKTELAAATQSFQQRLTQARAIRNVPTTNGCPDPRIDPLIRMCRNAAWGDPAAKTACQAGELPGATPAPVPPAG